MFQEIWREEMVLSFNKPQLQYNCAVKGKQQLKTRTIRVSYQETLIITRPRQEATISEGPGQQNGMMNVFMLGMCIKKE